MKLIAEKYQKLRPEIEYLSDEVIIAQAWKKTHKYMRILLHKPASKLEMAVCAGDNVSFPGAGGRHTLQATKKQDKEPDNFPSSCRYRIEESKG